MRKAAEAAAKKVIALLSKKKNALRKGRTPLLLPTSWNAFPLHHVTFVEPQ